MNSSIKLTILFALLPILLVTCKKDTVKNTTETPKLIPNFQLIPDFKLVTNIITSDSISITWIKPKDPQGLPVSFDISFNSQIILKDQTKTELNLGKLTPQTSYHIIVSAKDSLNKPTNSRLDFTTLSADDAKLIHKNILYQGRSREYGYYLPSRISYSNPPLVIYLHGAGGVAWPGLITSPFVDIAEREKFIFAMPQALMGTTSDGTYLQWNAHEVLAWDDAMFINNMADTLIKQYHINVNKIYVCGMSNGGFMTFYIAGRTNRFAAIAPMSGLMTYNIYNKYTTNWPVPLLYIHGTADNIVPYNGNQGMPPVENVLKFWIRNNSCDTIPTMINLPNKDPYDGSTVTFFNYHGTNPNSEICFYKINGGGHYIAGYEPGGNQDFKSFEVIWEFFKTKSK